MGNKFKSIIGVIAVIMCIATCTVVLTIAFDHTINQFNNSFEETKIQQLTNNGYIDLYVDLETDVIYVRAVNGTLTPMLNSDGTPKLWKK